MFNYQNKLNKDILDNKTINKIFNSFAKINPNPTTELNYKNDFELLIAVILSAQATDVSVNKATAKLFAVANTPKKILNFTEAELCNYIKSIGLFRVKASNILKTCKILLEKFNSKIPQNIEDLQTLPGVGRKTANVILNTLWKKPTIAVDTHVFRVSNRIGLVHAKNPLEAEKQLLQNIPPKFLINTHHWLILHGRYVCKAIKPKCAECFINHLCKYNNLIN